MQPAIILCSTILVVLIAGCATPAQRVHEAWQGCVPLAQRVHEARQTMTQSLGDYKACLAENLSDPSPCATLKAIFEADAQAATALSAGIEEGGSGYGTGRMGGIRAPLTRFPDRDTNCY
jgi:hypothetical protein